MPLFTASTWYIPQHDRTEVSVRSDCDIVDGSTICTMCMQVRPSTRSQSLPTDTSVCPMRLFNTLEIIWPTFANSSTLAASRMRRRQTINVNNHRSFSRFPKLQEKTYTIGVETFRLLYRYHCFELDNFVSLLRAFKEHYFLHPQSTVSIFHTCTDCSWSSTYRGKATGVAMVVWPWRVDRGFAAHLFVLPRNCFATWCRYLEVEINRVSLIAALKIKQTSNVLTLWKHL